MRERPILFSGDMVRSILDGRKTVTRRLVPSWQLPTETSQADGDKFRWMSVAQRDPRWGFGVFGRTEAECMAQYNEDGPRCCPFGNEGDRLWVREAFAYGLCTESSLAYRATHKPSDLEEGWFEPIKWTPSIQMPRWASRILLEVTAVRVERLQDITEEQAQTEGADPIRLDGLTASDISALDLEWADPETPYRNGFRQLRGSLDGDWDANPWVWVIEFKRVEASHA